MKGENPKQQSATVSAVVPGEVKAEIVKVGKSHDQTPSRVAARILEAWANNRPMPYRKKKAA